MFSSYLPKKNDPRDLQNDVFFDDFWHLPARWLLKVARVSQRATNRTPKVDQLLTRWLLKVARVSQRASNRTPKVDQPLTKWSKKCSGPGHPVQLQRFPYSPDVQFLKKSLKYHHGGTKATRINHLGFTMSHRSWALCHQGHDLDSGCFFFHGSAAVLRTSIKHSQTGCSTRHKKVARPRRIC